MCSPSFHMFLFNLSGTVDEKRWGFFVFQTDNSDAEAYRFAMFVPQMVQRTLNPKRISLSIKKSLNENTDELARRLSTSKKKNVRGPNKWAFLHIGWIGPSFRHRLGIVKVVFVCGLRFVEIADWHLQAFSGRQKQTNAVRASFIAKPPSFYNIF